MLFYTPCKVLLFYYSFIRKVTKKDSFINNRRKQKIDVVIKRFLTPL